MLHKKIKKDWRPFFLQRNYWGKVIVDVSADSTDAVIADFDSGIKLGGNNLIQHSREKEKTCQSEWERASHQSI